MNIPTPLRVKIIPVFVASLLACASTPIVHQTTTVHSLTVVRVEELQPTQAPPREDAPDRCQNQASVSDLAWYSGEDNTFDRIAQLAGEIGGGARYAPGRFGHGFAFDGSYGFVKLPHMPALSGHDVTLSAWVYGNAYMGDQVWLAGQAQRTQLNVSISHAAQLNFFGNDGAFHQVVNATPLPLHRWVHVAGVLSSCRDTTYLRLFQDGQFVAEQRFETTPAADPKCATWIGGVDEVTREGGCVYTGQFFNGRIDEVRFFGRALSDAEVASLASPQ